MYTESDYDRMTPEERDAIMHYWRELLIEVFGSRYAAARRSPTDRLVGTDRTVDAGELAASAVDGGEVLIFLN